MKPRVFGVFAALGVVCFALSTTHHAIAGPTAQEVTIGDLTIHIETARRRAASGDRASTDALVAALVKENPPSACTTVDAVDMGLLLADTGRDTDASRYFRAAASRAPDEAALDPQERSALAAAIYAIGRPEAAIAVLQRCRQRWPDRAFRCRSWTIAEVAAAKDDWVETARVLDDELRPDGKFTVTTGQTAPIRILKLRQQAAWHIGDKLEIGRWRAVLIRRGASPDEAASAPPPQAPARDARRSGVSWIIAALVVVLLSSVWLGRRASR